MDYLPDFIKKIPHHVDFAGQRLAERIFQVIIVASGVIGFVWGYLAQQFSLTVYTLIFGFSVSCLLTLPPWPFYRRHPLPWLKPVSEDTSKTAKNEAAGAQGNKQKKKKA